MKTHHLEYAEGGILYMDDMLSDLVEDRDKVRTKEEEEQVLSVFFFPILQFLCRFHQRFDSLYNEL